MLLVLVLLVLLPPLMAMSSRNGRSVVHISFKSPRQWAVPRNEPSMQGTSQHSAGWPPWPPMSIANAATVKQMPHTYLPPAQR